MNMSIDLGLRVDDEGRIIVTLQPLVSGATYGVQEHAVPSVMSRRIAEHVLITQKLVEPPSGDAEWEPLRAPRFRARPRHGRCNRRAP